MKFTIEAESQEEFDSKRFDLIKAIAGSAYDVSLRKRGEASPNQSREPYYKAQAEMEAYWNKKFQQNLNEIKRQIGEIIDEK